MKLATLRSGRPDGSLLVVSRDLDRAVDATAVAPDLRTALERWDAVGPQLQRLYDALNTGTVADAVRFDPARCAAPLPRAPQWLDGSAFLEHGRLMERAFGTPPIPDIDSVPLMYQGASDDFLGPCDDVPLPDEADGIDVEGEFGVVVGDVPMGTTAAQALTRVRLLVQINDWSLRRFGPREMRAGFGFLQAKPSTAFAPVAVTPDALGPAWRDGRVHLRLHVDCRGSWLGHPHGAEMAFGFGDLIAHAARTRRLAAGTVIGSGTVSNADPSAGSACIAERRMREMLEQGAAITEFLRFGESIRMTALDVHGNAPFGTIAQRVIANNRSA